MKRDQESHQKAKSGLVKGHTPSVIYRHEMINKAFEDDDERAAEETMAQHESSKAFVLKPHKVVELSHDESNVRVRLKL